MTSKNQVTIPVDALEEGGYRARRCRVVYADGEGRIVVERMESLIEHYAEKLSGTWPGGVEGFLEGRKRAWE